MKRRAAVIAYDISKNKIRRQVHRTLMEWRIDGQKSVAECALTTAEADELCLQLLDLIDPITDRLALVWLDTGQTIERWGQSNNPSSAWRAFYIDGVTEVDGHGNP